MIRNSIRAAIAALAIVVCAPQAFAIVTLPEEKVISSVAASEDQYLSPGNVTVIRPEDYAGEQKTLAGLMENIPGVTVVKGGNGHEDQIFIRGLGRNSINIYMDGVPISLNNLMMVPNPLDKIPPEQIERIEVYKGFVPARFGMQAMGGVINIVTRMPKEKETRLSLGIGSYGRFKTSASQSLPLGDGVLFGAMGYESYGGAFDYWNFNGTWDDLTDDFTAQRRPVNMEDLNFLLKWNDENWRVRAAYNNKVNDQLEGNNSYGVADVPGTPYSRPQLYDFTRWDLSLGRSQTHGSLRWGWDVSYSDAAYNYDSFGLYTHDIQFGYKRTTFALHGEMPLGERQMVSAVAEYVNEKYRQWAIPEDQPDQINSTLEEINLNLQDEIALDSAGTLLFTPSLRYNKAGGDGRFTWQAALTKELPSGLTLKTSYGTYARMPNVYERYGDAENLIDPNPDLKTETGTQFDAGVIWSGAAPSFGNASANASLTGYWRETDDLIDYISDPVTWQGQYQNMDHATTKGIEFAAGLDWEKWGFALSAGYTDSSNERAGAATDGRRRTWLPEWDAMARITRKFTRGSVFAEYRYVGDYYIDGNWTLMDASNVFNVGLRYNLSDFMSLTAGVNDVFDDMNGLRISDGVNHPGYKGTPSYPFAGRTYYLTLDAKM